MLTNLERLPATGWSLIEAMIAMAVFVIMASALIGLSVGALNPWLNTGGDAQARALAQEGLESARVIGKRAWNELIIGTSGLAWTNSAWQLSTATETIGDYHRQLIFSPVCRDINNQLAACPALTTDPHIVAAKVVVSWTTPAGLTKSLERKTYLSNWDSRFWTQADWSGGAGQELWFRDNKYDSGQNVDTTTPGEVKLARRAPQCQAAVWTFDNPDDYVYDPQKIEIVDGAAKLKQERQYVLSDAAISSAAVSQASLQDFPAVAKVADNVTIQGITGVVDVYALTQRVFFGNCELITMAISDDGLVRSARLSALTYQAGNCSNPTIFKVSDNVWGVAYVGPRSTGYLKTLPISNAGLIGTVINTYSFNASSFPYVYKLPNQRYALAYNLNNGSRLATIAISDAGLITPNLISQRALGSVGSYFAVNNWLNNVYIVNYSSSGQVALQAVEIDSAGTISSVIGEYLVSASATAYKSGLVKSGTYGALSYINNSGNAIVGTVAISSTGTISQSFTDSLVVASGVQHVGLTSVPGETGNFFVVDYNTTAQGSLALIDISPITGQVSNQVWDSFNFVPGNYHAVFALDSTHTAVAFRQSNGLTAINTLAIEAGAWSYVPEAVIYPKNLYTPTTVDSWRGFEETAVKNGGSIVYQLKTTTGDSYRYWDGATWSTTGNDLPNHSASEVNDNIPLLETDSRSIGFKAILRSDGSRGVNLEEIKIDCRNLQFEIGTLTANQEWQTVDLLNSYVDPVVVASAYIQNNTAPASVRINNVTGTSLAARLHNPSNSNLLGDTVTYFVAERGLWRLGNLKMEVDKHTTNTTGSYAAWPYDQINFKGGANFFSVGPLVLHQVMTNNDNAWITSYVSNLTSLSSPPGLAGMRLGLNAAETATSHQTETIGWMAMERDVTGQTSNTAWETYLSRSTTPVMGHDNGCYRTDYRNNYAVAPLTIVSQQTVNDPNDGSWAQMCNQTRNRAYFQVDEDQVQDAERLHTTEIVGALTMAQAFNYYPSAGSAYATLGFLTSSAIDLGVTSKIQVIEWLETIPQPTTAIKLQLRAAPDNNGRPGVWGPWYGALGPETYFTAASGALIDVALNNNQWVQYRVRLSSDGTATPILKQVKINHKP